ncbi:MAG: hypothetical protein L0213_05240, partial [Candidatus Dadabacteria bacterium]|nr:hypothetical protein [Candidatus Dadabacteria bacterium]
MKKRAERSLKVVDVEDKLKEQAETAKEQYLGWMEMNRNFTKEALKAMDMQFELWLTMQLGLLDFMKNVFEVHPMVKPFEHHLSPYAEHMENLGEYNREFFEMKKRKAEKFARNLQRYHRKTVESTLTAFDKYCEMLSTA